MNKQIEEVRTFMKACDHPTPDRPIQQLELTDAKLFVKLILEELQELTNALGLDIEFRLEEYNNHNMEHFDQVEVLDALTDLLYTVIGTAVACGHHKILNQAFAKVHFSNMTKVANDKVVKDGMGKVMKTAGYMAPQLELLFDE